MACDLCNAADNAIVHDFGNWQVRRCLSCSLHFATPVPSAQTLADLYSEHYYSTHDVSCGGYVNYRAEAELRRRTFHRWFEHIEKFAEPQSCLDVGCAYGYSLNSASERGWKVEGLDVSPNAIETARLSADCKFYNGDFIQFPLDKQYNLITAWDVVEHTLSPMAFFSKANSLLPRGGLLAFALPDVGSLYARIWGRSWWQFKYPDHLFYLDAATTRRYLEATGFELLRVRYARKYKTLAAVIARLCNTSRFGRLEKLLKGRHPVYYCSFSESLFIARKKSECAQILAQNQA